MSDISTSDCKKFLDEELQLSSSAWKRASKKKNEAGEWERVFECVKNQLRVVVVESDQVLFLDRKESLSPQSTNNAGPKTPEIKSSPVPSKKVEALFKELVFIFSLPWEYFMMGGISLENGEEADFQEISQRLSKAIQAFNKLSENEKGAFAFLQKNNINNLVETAIKAVADGTYSLMDLDETYLAHHIQERFSDYGIGVVEGGEFIYSLAKLYLSEGIPLGQNVPKIAAESSAKLLETCEYALDHQTLEDEELEEFTSVYTKAQALWRPMPTELGIKSDQYMLDKKLKKAPEALDSAEAVKRILKL